MKHTWLNFIAATALAGLLVCCAVLCSLAFGQRASIDARNPPGELFVGHAASGDHQAVTRLPFSTRCVAAC